MKQIKWQHCAQALFAGLMAVIFLPSITYATPINFDVEGHWDRGIVPGGGDFNGFMAVDTDSGVISSMGITFAGFPTLPTFDTILHQQGSSHQWLVSLGNGRLDPFGSPERVSFSIIASPGIGSLVDFEGGTIRQGASGILTTGTPIRIFLNFKGTITPTVVTVPEPATLVIFAFGALILGGCTMLRRKRNTANKSIGLIQSF